MKRMTEFHNSSRQTGFNEDGEGRFLFFFLNTIAIHTSMSLSLGRTIQSPKSSPQFGLVVTCNFYGAGTVPCTKDYVMRIEKLTPVGEVLSMVLRWIETTLHRWVIAGSDLGMRGDVSHWMDESRTSISMERAFGELKHDSFGSLRTGFAGWSFTLYIRKDPMGMIGIIETLVHGLTHKNPSTEIVLPGMSSLGPEYSFTAIENTFREWSDLDTAIFSALLGEHMVCVRANNRFYVAVRKSLEHLKTCHPSLSDMRFEQLFQHGALPDDIQWIVDRIIFGGFESTVVITGMNETQATILNKYGGERFLFTPCLGDNDRNNMAPCIDDRSPIV